MSSPEEPKKETKQLTPAQWAEVVMLWELGETQLEDLQTRFGITISGLSKGLKSRGATKGSRAHEVAAKVKETVLKAREEETLTDEQERQRRIKETRSQHYDWARGLSQQVMACFMRAAKDGKPFSSETDNVKVLRQAMATLAIGRAERFAVLNADEDMGEGELPTLPIEDLSEADIREIQQSDDNDDAILEAELDNEIVELT